MRQWSPPKGQRYGMPLTSDDGWILCDRHDQVRRRWYVVSPLGEETVFETDGGLYLAIDMANAYIDGDPMRMGKAEGSDDA